MEKTKSGSPAEIFRKTAFPGRLMENILDMFLMNLLPRILHLSQTFISLTLLQAMSFRSANLSHKTSQLIIFIPGRVMVTLLFSRHNDTLTKEKINGLLMK